MDACQKVLPPLQQCARTLTSRSLSETSINVQSRDFMTRDCNCKPGHGTKFCVYRNVCGEALVIYKATCLRTGKYYIGCTQQFLKDRMKGHEQDIRKLYINNKKSDTYASHFMPLVRQYSGNRPQQPCASTYLRNMRSYGRATQSVW